MSVDPLSSALANAISQDQSAFRAAEVERNQREKLIGTVRNIKCVAVSGELFSAWVRDGWTLPGGNVTRIRCRSGIPFDATYMRTFYMPDRDLFGLFFYHPDFESIDEGDSIPVVECQFIQEHYINEST